MRKQKELTELIASTLLKNGFKTITHVPGFGGTQVFNELNRKTGNNFPLSLNEEAAFSISIGSAIQGKRSATLIKTHGLTKMANALCSTLSIQSNAANLIFAFDDVEGKSSDNIFDSKRFIEGTEAPFVILGKNPEQEIGKAIDLSESLRLPVVIHVDCRNLGKNFEYNGDRTPQKKTKFKKNPLDYLACPPLTRFQRDRFLNKTAGTTRKKKDPIAPEISFPEMLPEKLKTTFLSYQNVFEALSSLSPDFVAGDAGTSALYAFHEKKLVDACTYMGGAPGMALGAYLAGAKNVWAVSGDFSFLAAGILGWNEVISRSAPIKLILFFNRKADATGGQDLPASVMENFIEGHRKMIRMVRADETIPKITRILRAMNSSRKPEICVVVFDR